MTDITETYKYLEGLVNFWREEAENDRAELDRRDWQLEQKDARIEQLEQHLKSRVSELEQEVSLWKGNYEYASEEYSKSLTRTRELESDYRALLASFDPLAEDYADLLACWESQNEPAEPFERRTAHRWEDVREAAIARGQVTEEGIAAARAEQDAREEQADRYLAQYDDWTDEELEEADGQIEQDLYAGHVKVKTVRVVPGESSARSALRQMTEEAQAAGLYDDPKASEPVDTRDEDTFTAPDGRVFHVGQRVWGGKDGSVEGEVFSSTSVLFNWYPLPNKMPKRMWADLRRVYSGDVEPDVPVGTRLRDRDGVVVTKLDDKWFDEHEEYPFRWDADCAEHGPYVEVLGGDE